MHIYLNDYRNPDLIYHWGRKILVSPPAAAIATLADTVIVKSLDARRANSRL